ncbi:MAG: DedA family protein [Candidatus Falkowbacteria bacterium]
MIHAIIAFIVGWVTTTITAFGAWAVFGLMTLESANIPIPSEVILTYAGFLVSQGTANIHVMALAGALGCLTGSVFSYYLGLRLGRPFLWRHGKWLLVTQADIIRAEKFLEKYGEFTYFFSRLLPVVRTFISLVIGISRGNFWKSTILGFFASWLWSYVLVWAGFTMGEYWDSIKPWWDKLSIIIGGAIILAIIWHIVRVVRAKHDHEEVKVI